MSHEIKFKAWIKSRKEFAEHIFTMYNPFAMGEGITDIDVTFDDNLFETVTIHQDDFELLQYTGLKDKNGTEIYEGDILSRNFFNSMDFWDSRRVVEIDPMHGVDAIPCCFSRMSNGEPSSYEVIGNIYQNKELLETKE
jgi:uncharacterized phage protein (TIGR01671 family)